MTQPFLSEQEKDYLMDRAEFIKVSAGLRETVDELKKAFAGGSVTQRYKPEIPDEAPGLNLQITFPLDNVTSEKMEEAFPEIKKCLAEYHRLRIHQREIEKRLSRVREKFEFEVIPKE